MEAEAKYIYRREDNGELVTMEFEAVMRQDAAGFITLEDGVSAKRCVHLEGHERRKAEVTIGLNKPVVSDSLGFVDQEFDEREAERVKHCFTGIEFVRDKDVPQFYQVKCATRGPEWYRYLKLREYNDNNSSAGGRAVLSEDQLRRAEELARREIFSES